MLLIIELGQKSSYDGQSSLGWQDNLKLFYFIAIFLTKYIENMLLFGKYQSFEIVRLSGFNHGNSL